MSQLRKLLEQARPSDLAGFHMGKITVRELREILGWSDDDPAGEIPEAALRAILKCPEPSGQEAVTRIQKVRLE